MSWHRLPYLYCRLIDCLASPIAALSGVQFNKRLVQGVLTWSERG